MGSPRGAKLAVACALAVMGVAAGCWREVSDDDLLPHVASRGPWAVDGVVLGSPAERCLERFGEPDRRLPVPRGNTLWQWTSRHQIGVTVDAGGRVTEVSGSSLTDRDGRVVVWSSAGEEDVRAILPDARVERSDRPRGSGVISLGREHVGSAYIVADDLGSYTVSVHLGQLASVTGQRQPTVAP